jgi:hypothetical protein
LSFRPEERRRQRGDYPGSCHTSEREGQSVGRSDWSRHESSNLPEKILWNQQRKKIKFSEIKRKKQL